MSSKLGHGNEQGVDPLRDYFYISLLGKKKCFNSPILPILAFFLASFFFDLSPFLCVSCYWSYNCSFLFCVIAPDFFFYTAWHQDTQYRLQNSRAVELNHRRTSIESWTESNRISGRKKDRKMPHCEWVCPAILLETTSDSHSVWLHFQSSQSVFLWETSNLIWTHCLVCFKSTIHNCMKCAKAMIHDCVSEPNYLVWPGLVL